MTRSSSRTSQPGPGRLLRLVIAGVIMLLIVATMISLHSPKSAAKPAPLFLDPPTNLSVTATSSTSVSLSWTAPAGGVDHYEVWRSDTISGSFVVIGNASGTSFNDSTVTNLRAYLYSVRAVASGGITSVASNIALGTAISFEFSGLQGNAIKAQHFHDVRTAINAVRTAANLPAATWTRASLNNLDIKTTDIQEMRDKLTEALTALAIAVPAYTDPVLSSGPGGTLIKAVHVEQLQARSTRGSSTNTPNPNPSPTPCSTSTNASVVGRFDPNVISLPLVPVHISVLPDGRILFWGRDRDVAGNGAVKEVAGKSEAYVWNINDGSNKTDVAVFRPSESKWYIINSSTGASQATSLGNSGDVPAPGDYDGDGKADLAVFSPNALWTIVNSSDGSVRTQSFGISGDVPVPGDYDQDGKTDLAIYRPSNGLWGILNSQQGTVTAIGWGIPGDIPVPGDYDRDRRNDLAVYRPSEGTWYIRKSSTTATLTRQWGISGDVPAPGDYNGDGTTDPAVYRPSDGNYYVGNIIVPEFAQTLPLGQSPSAVVVSGDFDGDGKTDPAIFRPADGNWQIRDSSTGLVELRPWGQNGDVPVPKDYDGMLRVANSTTNVFCSGHSFLPDGRLLVSGGHRSPDFDAAGEPYTNIFDYRTNCWTRGPNLNHGRWYPYNVVAHTGPTTPLHHPTS
jgi:putative transposon-encoded protein